MRIVRLRRDLTYRTVSGAAGPVLLAVGETRSVMIDDPCCVRLAPLLDGSRDLAGAAAELADTDSILAVSAAIRRLDGLGLLVDGPDHPGAPGWDAHGIGSAALAELGGRPICVHDYTAGSAPTSVGSPVLTALAVAGLPVVEAGGDGHVLRSTLCVALVDSVLDPRLAAINEDALAQQRDWVLVRPRGAVALLGPHFRPGETGCLCCLQQRWIENEQVETFLLASDPAAGRLNPAVATLPSTALLAGALLAPALAAIATGARSEQLTGALVAVDTRTLVTDRHPLTRQPQCAACGDPSLTRRPPGPDFLTGDLPPDAESFARAVDGGSRTRTAAATYAAMDRHVSRYLGVVTKLVSIDPDPDGVTFSYGAGHNFAQPVDPTSLRRNLRGQSGGKGRTEIQAKVSAIGEAVERYCGVWRADRPIRTASAAEIGADGVSPDLLAQFSIDQVRDRLHSNGELAMFHRVPVALPPNLPIDWSPAWSLTAERTRYVPAGYCWYGHPDVARHDLGMTDSNGCAAGNTRAEAVLQGFCELVERDAVALWWYHRSRLPGVDLDSWVDPWIAGQQAHYGDRLDRDLWALDLTADLGVPAFAAVSARRHGDPQDVLVGFGAHLNPTVALHRALTELNQFLPGVTPIPGRRQRYQIEDAATVRWLTDVKIEEQQWLCPDPAATPTTLHTHHDATSGDLVEDVARCVKLADRAGLEVLVVDQSRPDIDLAVVKVIVPGLRHFWRRLGPGRLWDVPRALGRAPVAVDESEMNPYSVFF